MFLKLISPTKKKFVYISVHSLQTSQNLNARIHRRQKWDSEDMSRAVISIRNGDWNQVQASKMYKVPLQTLQRYLKKDELTVSKLGREP
jgi:hypothetical protein